MHWLKGRSGLSRSSFFEGKTLTKIATEEGVNVVAVIKRRDAALVNLKKFLKK